MPIFVSQSQCKEGSVWSTEHFVSRVDFFNIFNIYFGCLAYGSLKLLVPQVNLWLEPCACKVYYVELFG